MTLIDRDEAKPIRLLVWLYLILVVFEGALRKWGPGALNYPLLIARDPVVALIYVIAISKGVFPGNLTTIVLGILTLATSVCTMTVGHGNFLVMLYGVHYNFFHFPLIWVMAATLTKRDIMHLGAAFLIMTIPNGILMYIQHGSSPYAWINKGVGDGPGGQLDDGLGGIRPAGLFTFTTGNGLFIPLATAFFAGQISEKRTLPIWLLLPSAGMILFSLAFSVSRTMVLATGIVIVGLFIASILRGGKGAGRLLLLGSLTAIVIFIMYLAFPAIQDGFHRFALRWEKSTGEEVGGVESAIIGRFFAGFSNALVHLEHSASIMGAGLGLGSNVGARFLRGKMGFALAEDEWSRVVLELGIIFGVIFLIVRICIVLSMLVNSLQALLNRKSAFPFLLFTAAGLPILHGQLGPPTMLGFTIFGCGAAFAALNDEEEEEWEDEDWEDEEYEEDEYYDDEYEEDEDY